MQQSDVSDGVVGNLAAVLASLPVGVGHRRADGPIYSIFEIL
jgi:hypothetical protein